jgi:glycosyltransferase involved in cell wall biosynthesis
VRIAQIVASLEARHGGPSRSVRGLSAALAAAGHEVELLTTEPGLSKVETPARGLTVRTFPRQWPQSLATSSGMDYHLRANNNVYDIYHHHGLWLRPLDYAWRFANRAGSPLVISPRGMMAPWAWGRHRWKKRLANLFIHPGALTIARGWHATSEAEAADIRRLGFTQPVCVAPNGVEPPAAADLTAARDFWLKQCPDAGGRPVALFHSRFHPMKRVIELIDLWLERKDDGWLLLMAGIPEEFSVAELRDYVYRAGGGERVAVFDGSNRPPPYAVANLFLLPSHSENFGLVVAEALAHGLPALTTDTTPWTALGKNGVGRCVPWDKFPAALGALLAEGPDRLRARGEAARAWAAAELGWKKPAALLAEFYAALRAQPA